MIAIVRIFAGPFVGRLCVGLSFLCSTSTRLFVFVVIVTQIRAGSRTGFLAFFLLALGLLLVVVAFLVIVLVVFVG